MGDRPTRSMQDWARDAQLVQNACNLSGVVHSFSRLMTDLRETFPNRGTDFFNTHPLAVAFSSKIASLTGSEPWGAVSEAFESIDRVAKGEATYE